MPTSSTSDFLAPEQPETPDVAGAYPRLTDEQLMLLRRFGEEGTAQGCCPVLRGDRDCDFFVLLDGAAAVVQETDGDPRLIGVHGPGRFLGDLSLLTGHAVYHTAIAQDDVEVLAVPVDRLKEAGRRSCARRPDPPCVHGPQVVGVGIGAGLRIIGSRFTADTRRLREFASRNRVPHRWIDLEQDKEAEAILQRLDIPPKQTPVVIWKETTSCAIPATLSWRA